MKNLGTYNHKLRHNKASTLPRNIIFVDTEAKEEHIRPEEKIFHFKIGVACYCRRRTRKLHWSEEWLTFEQTSKFWDWSISKIRNKTKLYLIAHNQHFDFACLNGFKNLYERGFLNTFHVLDSDLFIAHFKKGSKSLIVLDLFNWFKFSVEKMGNYLNLPKLNIDFLKTNKKYLTTYCKRDVEIIKDMFLNWLRFIKLHQLGKFTYSTAGQAYQAFQHRFMKHTIMIHNNSKITALEREAYMGGRSEAFKLGKINSTIYCLDFNSLYPSVMKDNNFPTSFVKYVAKASPNWLKMAIKDYSIIANCYIEISKPIAPKRKKRLLFPIGKFWTTIPTPEIQFLIAKDAIIQAKDVILYKQAPIFNSYISFLYNLRKQFISEENQVYNLLTKLLLNSLYGKFGQLKTVKEQLGKCNIDQIWVKDIIKHSTGERLREYAFGGIIWVQKSSKKEWKHSFPAICAHVTSFARIKLLNAILKAKWENVIYCDTDSIFVTPNGLKNLKQIIHPTKLGYLKVEKETDNLTIHGLKDYKFGKNIKRKGIKKTAKQLSSNVFKQDQWLKTKSLIKKASLDKPIVKTITKTLKRQYHKGEVQEDNSIIPFVISEPFL